MKKFIAVALIALTVLTGAFAWGAKQGPDMMVGLKTGWGMDFQKNEVAGVSVETKNHAVPVLATFVLDLDVPVSIHTDLGAKIDIFGGEHVETKTNTTMALLAGAAYRYDVNDELALRAGLDFGYNLYLDVESNKDLKSSVTTTLHYFGLYADLGASYEVADSVQLLGGVKLGGTLGVAGSVVTDIAGHKTTAKSDAEAGTNFSFAINVGAAYQF